MGSEVIMQPYRKWHLKRIKQDLRGQERESVEEFLARGGMVRRVTPARAGVSEEAILKAIQNILARER